MKRLYILCFLIWTFIVSFASAQEVEKQIKVLYTAQSGYQPDELQMLARMFEDLTGIEVKIEYVKYEDQYAKISESANKYDVLSLDQIWLADLVSKQILSPLTQITKTMREDLPPAVLKAFQYQKQTWALPFLMNFQLFFYNEKMIKLAGFEGPPKTLEDMVEQMHAMKEQQIVEYPWTDSWRQGEGLICEYVWLTGAFGGDIFDRGGNPIFDQEPGVKALEFMVMLLKARLTNSSILTNDETAAKDDFITEQAAFTSNWTFQQGFLNDPTISPIAGQAKMGLLPASKYVEQRTASVSGFQGIAITASSQNQEAAWKWIEFFTSPLVQRAYLFEMPVWISVQTSQDANMLDPMMAIKQEQLSNVHHRPNIPNYANVSAILQRYLYAALEGKLEPTDALAQAKTEIEALTAESNAKTTD